MFLEICLHIHSVVFAVSRQINEQNECEKLKIRCAGNKVFVKYQTQGGCNPTPPCVRPWRWLLHCFCRQMTYSTPRVDSFCALCDFWSVAKYCRLCWHGRNLVGDTGDVSPHFFRWRGHNMRCPPTFSLQVLYLEKFQKQKWRLPRFVWSAYHVRCYT